MNLVRVGRHYIVKPNTYDSYIDKIESLTLYWNNVNEMLE